MTAVLVGTTGLVGSHILTTLINSSKYSSVHAYSRKRLATESTKLQVIETKETETWKDKFPAGASALFSALGTTRGNAGGFAAQRKVDYDLNLELAEAAKKAGVETYVLISSAGASTSSSLPYMKLKGDIEDAVAKVGFKHTIILRPGLLLGDRQETRISEGILRSVASFAGKIGGPKWVDGWAQDVDVIAKAGVNAALQCSDGTRKEEGVWLIDQAEILKLGKTEWID